MSGNAAALEITCSDPYGDPLQVRLSLVGEIDIAANTTLADTIDWLIAQAPAVVVVDLADVTFASAALPNFLTRAAMALPAVAVVVRYATPLTTWVLRATGLPNVVTIADGGGSHVHDGRPVSR
jgi:hypothetical protein